MPFPSRMRCRGVLLMVFSVFLVLISRRDAMGAWTRCPSWPVKASSAPARFFPEYPCGSHGVAATDLSPQNID